MGRPRHDGHAPASHRSADAARHLPRFHLPGASLRRCLDRHRRGDRETFHPAGKSRGTLTTNELVTLMRHSSPAIIRVALLAAPVLALSVPASAQTPDSKALTAAYND